MTRTDCASGSGGEAWEIVPGFENRVKRGEGWGLCGGGDGGRLDRWMARGIHFTKKPPPQRHQRP